MLREDLIKYGIPIIEKFGYIKHPNLKINNETNYLLTEIDGYINICMDLDMNKDVIWFQKCFYGDVELEKVINEYFYTVNDFITFIKNFHIKIERCKKLEKINKNDNL